MSLERYTTALLVVLLVVGLGGAAATFETGGFTTDGAGEPATSTGDGGSAPTVVAYVYTFVVLAILLAMLGIAVGIFFEGTSVRGMAAIGAGFALVAVVFLATVDVQSALEGASGASDGVDPVRIAESLLGEDAGGRPAGGATGDGGIDAVSPVVVLAALGGVVLAGLVGAAYFSRGTPEEPAVDATDSADDATATVGEAAGRAAERVGGQVDLSNAVYRAWRDMTDALDVSDPATTTPAEFADRAVAAGLDEDHVDDLTELFREVRYGSAPVTPERERRAAETLRRIEAAYADPTDGGGADA